MSGAGSTPRPRGRGKTASGADLAGNLGRDLAEAEAAIATAKQTYYDALNRRHRALRALAREREELSGC